MKKCSPRIRKWLTYGGNMPMKAPSCRSNLKQKAARLDQRSRPSLNKTRLYGIGGSLAFPLMLSVMLGACQTAPTIVNCRVDRSLLQPLALAQAPQSPTNGDLATANRDLRDAVAKDNANKELLRKQLESCE